MLMKNQYKVCSVTQKTVNLNLLSFQKFPSLYCISLFTIQYIVLTTTDVSTKSCQNNGYFPFVRCEPGHYGETCMPDNNLQVGVDDTLDSAETLWEFGWRVIGGHVVGPAEEATGTGCGPMTSSNYLHFDKVSR